MAQDISLHPVAGWQLGTSHSHGLVALKFDYSSHPPQNSEEGMATQMFALKSEQARELAKKLLEAADRLESTDGEGEDLLKH
ncbi:MULTISPECIES: hypothetical protein [Halomonas]|uniref:BssS family protein n=1 Tax=Halomonas binhaiensis TaxID=2562282 RepID=A0A5C1NET3_9GAMM|nr:MULTISPECIES: hypothetical protein [Halomonas]QEM81724.1 hypothetical protein E4T21_09315 [Halomonas binhaiensis]